MSLELNTKKILSFDDLIGQEAAKKTLMEKCDAAIQGGPLVSFGLFDGPGMGKTALAQAAGKYLVESGEFKVLFVNCKGGHNKTDSEAMDLFTAIWESHNGGKRVVVILDEAFTREASGSLQNELSGILSKIGGNSRGGEEIKIYGTDDSITYNPKRLSFILLSWNPVKAAADIRTRFPQEASLRLIPYTAEELADIIKIQMEIFGKSHGNGAKLHATNYALGAISRSMRGNARQAEGICQKIAQKTILNPNYSLSRDNVADFMRELGINPQGLSSLELKILTACHAKPYSAAELIIKANESKENINRAALYLQEQLGNTAQPFQLYDSETGEALTYEERGQVYYQCGALIEPAKNKMAITLHGKRIYSICKRAGFIQQ